MSQTWNTVVEEALCGWLVLSYNHWQNIKCSCFVVKFWCQHNSVFLVSVQNQFAVDHWLIKMTVRASYDELIKQVRSLEEENTHLRRELLFSSSGHLVSRHENESVVSIAGTQSSGRDSNSGLGRMTVATGVNTVSATSGHFLTDSYASKQSPPVMHDNTGLWDL